MIVSKQSFHRIRYVLAKALVANPTIDAEIHKEIIPAVHNYMTDGLLPEKLSYKALVAFNILLIDINEAQHHFEETKRRRRERAEMAALKLPPDNIVPPEIPETMTAAPAPEPPPPTDKEKRREAYLGPPPPGYKPPKIQKSNLFLDMRDVYALRGENLRLGQTIFVTPEQYEQYKRTGMWDID